MFQTLRRSSERTTAGAAGKPKWIPCNRLAPNCVMCCACCDISCDLQKWIEMGTKTIYLLVSIQKNMNTSIFSGNIRYKWPFSIAMLVCQRVQGQDPQLCLLLCYPSNQIKEPQLTNTYNHFNYYPINIETIVIIAINAGYWRYVDQHGSLGSPTSPTL